MHNLADRTELALAHGLVLRKLTREHLVKMTDDREYLVSRYGPDMSATLSLVNRLMATLNQLARKVRIRIAPGRIEVTGLNENEPGVPQTAAGARSPRTRDTIVKMHPIASASLRNAGNPKVST